MSVGQTYQDSEELITSTNGTHIYVHSFVVSAYEEASNRSRDREDDRRVGTGGAGDAEDAGDGSMVAWRESRLECLMRLGGGRESRIWGEAGSVTTDVDQAT